MLALSFKNLLRRPLRTVLSLIGLAVSVAVLASITAFGEGYEAHLRGELDGMGVQLMLVPLGCPYDAAARVLKGRALDVSLPAGALASARADKSVAIAAPIFSGVIPRTDQGRTDLWVGIDESTKILKPWWRLTTGSTWFRGPNSVILGAEAAATEMRKPGDKLFSPETGREMTVCGVLTRNGTSDDSQFFVPLATAQAMFHQPGRLTAVAIRLKDPEMLGEASDRLQTLPGAQVVTLTEMMGTFLNLLGATRTLILAITLVAVVISALSIFNTIMASVMERTRELGVLRAVGMPRVQAFGLMLSESLILSLLGGLAGLLIALVAGHEIDQVVRPFIPLAPENDLPVLTGRAIANCFLLIALVGGLAGVYPAWQASRLTPAEALKYDT
jgi:putative ABC transport system permease protein